jgi:hypothetical protein
VAVLEGTEADEHAGVAALNGVGRATRMVQGFAGHLQEQALLGVHHFGLTRGDAEVVRVEGLDVVEEGALPDDVFDGCPEGGTGREGASACGRQVPDEVPSRQKLLPESLRAAEPSPITAMGCGAGELSPGELPELETAAAGARGPRPCGCRPSCVRSSRVEPLIVPRR